MIVRQNNPTYVALIHLHVLTRSTVLASHQKNNSHATMEPEIELPPSIQNIPPPGMGLVEELDKLLMVQLRDGKKLIGTMRSFDQFANIVLEGAYVLMF